MTADEKPLSLSKEGETSFVIVTVTEPAFEERTAATWLSETLEQVTGAKFPIRSPSRSGDQSARCDCCRAIHWPRTMTSPSGSVAAYFYAYPPTGMIAVPNRTSLSKFVAAKSETHATAEFRIPWTDLPTEAMPGDELMLNIATYPKLDSKNAKPRLQPVTDRHVTDLQPGLLRHDPFGTASNGQVIGDGQLGHIGLISPNVPKEIDTDPRFRQKATAGKMADRHGSIPCSDSSPLSIRFRNQFEAKRIGDK